MQVSTTEVSTSSRPAAQTRGQEVRNGPKAPFGPQSLGGLQGGKESQGLRTTLNMPAFPVSELLPGRAPSEGWSMIRTARSPARPRSSFISATRLRAHKVCKAHSALGRWAPHSHFLPGPSPPPSHPVPPQWVLPTDRVYDPTSEVPGLHLALASPLS